MRTVSDPIAVVGIGCRLPGGVTGAGDFWRLLHDGVDAVDEVPPDRWDANALYHPDPAIPGRMNTRWGGFIGELDAFDSDFFSIAPVEAETMDPQQRIMLEVAYEAMQDAGSPASNLAGAETGVYIGASGFDHGARQFVDTSRVGPYMGTGSVLSIIANRISYAFDFRGPSLVVDTACSSSLAAVHAAAQALRSGEISTALAGGVSVLLNPNVTMGFSKGGFMASDGRCKAFDHRADGYVRSEGAGVVVLRRLSDALTSNDRIYAVVRGSSIHQDGRSNGLFAPNRLAQQEMLRAAYQNAGVEPRDVDYIEAHGTGTALGDPIEVGALSNVLTEERDRSRSLRIGSVKSNLGHLEAAAGIAGLIKTALSLHHRTLVPSIHFERPNPMLRLERSPIKVQTRVEEWPDSDGRAPLAGVSSFGFGGTLAHVVLEGHQPDAPESARSDDAEPEAREPRLIPLSAKTGEALAATAEQWAQAADDAAGPEWLQRAAATAAHRRDHHQVRTAVVAGSAAEAAEALRAVASGRRHSGSASVRRVLRDRRRAVFVFSGQGGQWLGMGRRLAETSPGYRSVLRQCDDELKRHLGRRLFDDERGLTFDAADTVQPAIFASQVALVAAWRELGVEPAAVVGHSLGEVAAAHVAGALSLSDAARVICSRSRLLAELEGTGGMLMTELDPAAAAELAGEDPDDLAVASANGPRSTVLAGGLDALARVEAELERREVFFRRVAVGFAAHSPHVERLQPALREALCGIAPEASSIPFYSTVTAAGHDGHRLGPDYWAENLRRTVRFSEAAQRLHDEVSPVFVEISPHPVLGRTLSESMPDDAVVIASTRRDDDEFAAIQRGLGELYTAGVPVSFPSPQTQPVDLPTYPWQRRRYPLLLTEVTGPGGLSASNPEAGALLDRPVRHPDRPEVRIHPVRVGEASTAYLNDHKVDQVILAPAALWMSACAEAARRSGATLDAIVTDLTVDEPLSLSSDEAPEVQLTTSAGGGETAVAVESFAASGGRRVHATAMAATDETSNLGRLDFDAILERSTKRVDTEEFYRRARDTGIDYGPAFQGLVELSVGEGEALGRFALPDSAHGHAGALAHPAAIDACLQAIGSVVPAHLADHYLPLPVGAERLRFSPVGIGSSGWCHVRTGEVVASEGGVTVYADLDCADESGTVRWQARGVRIRLAPGSSVRSELLAVEWIPYSPRPADRRSWTVLADGGGESERLKDLLAEHGGPATLWDTAGDERWASAEAWATSENSAPDEVVCAWGLDDGHEPMPDRARDLTARLLRLVQAIVSAPWPRTPPRLTVLTRGGLGDSDPAAAALWGLGRCVANELPETGLTLVELAEPVDRLADRLASALLDPELPGQVRLDAKGCTVPKLAEVSIPEADEPVPVDPDRSYLVTGGLGALGRTVAERLVERGARHLVLVGRSGPGTAAQADIERWRSQGTTVETVRLDVAKAAAVEHLIADWDGDRPPLAGVIHCAGALADASALRTGAPELSRTFAGKVHGAWNLHRSLEGRTLDFFVLFSSLAGTLGSPGQSAYAAANTVLDALAAYRNSRGEPAVSIAWGTWADEGLGARSGEVERLAGLGLLPLSRQEGLRLFDAATRGGLPQVCAALIDSDRFDGADFGPAAEQLTAGTRLTRPADRNDDAEAPADPGTRVHRAVAEVLGTETDRVPTDAVFADLGFDSLMVMALRRKLETEFGLRISAAVVWSYPTVDELVPELLRRREAAAPAAVSRPGEADPDLTTERTDRGVDATPDPPTNQQTSVDSDADLIEALTAQVSIMKGNRT